MYKKNRKIGLLLALGDLFHLNLAFYLSYFIKFQSFNLSDQYTFLFVIYNLFWILFSSYFNFNRYERERSVESIVYKLFNVTVVQIFSLITLLFILKESFFSREFFIYVFSLSFILILIWRLFAVYLIKKYRSHGFNYRRVVIVGNGIISKQIYDYFKIDESHGYRLESIFYEEDLKNDFHCDQREIGQLENFCLDSKIDEIYYTLPTNDNSKIEKLIAFCDQNFIRLKIIPDFRSFKYRKVSINFYGAIPVITLRTEPLQEELNRFIKRVFDIFFSLFVFVFIYTWMVPIVAILIRIESKGPIFFKQLRSGIDNKKFYCYKFRSMYVNDASDEKQATKDDIRVTKIGKILRKTSLDEFPQFFNVLKGEMSVVGPRPHMIKHTHEYSKQISSFMVRHLAKPGITGAAQANGFRGEIITTSDIERRVEYDVWYIENWSLLLDIKLIILTVINIFKGQEKAH